VYAQVFAVIFCGDAFDRSDAGQIARGVCQERDDGAAALRVAGGRFGLDERAHEDERVVCLCGELRAQAGDDGLIQLGGHKNFGFTRP
jgi:hypothetical protein